MFYELAENSEMIRRSPAETSPCPASMTSSRIESGTAAAILAVGSGESRGWPPPLHLRRRAALLLCVGDFPPAQRPSRGRSSNTPHPQTGKRSAFGVRQGRG